MERPDSWRCSGAVKSVSGVAVGGFALDGQRFQNGCGSRSGAQDECADDAKDERDDEDTQGCGEQLSRIERSTADGRAPRVGSWSGNDCGWQDDIVPGPVLDSVVMLWLFIAPSLISRWSKGWGCYGLGLNGQRMAYKRMGSLAGIKGG